MRQEKKKKGYVYISIQVSLVVGGMIMLKVGKNHKVATIKGCRIIPARLGLM